MIKLNQNKHYMIDGDVGKLEVELDWPKTITVDDTVVIICHPHPLYQGSMHNKVVTTISRAFIKLGLLTVRFNYRGVGKSDGEYAEGLGELDDLLAVVKWLRLQNMAKKIILSGFSFGGSIAYKGASKIEGVTELLMVAPSVVHFNLTQEKEPEMTFLVILSDDDETVPAADTLNWLTQTYKGSFQLIKFTQAGHFFHGRLVELREEIIKHYALRVKNDS